MFDEHFILQFVKEERNGHSCFCDDAEKIANVSLYKCKILMACYLDVDSICRTREQSYISYYFEIFGTLTLSHEKVVCGTAKGGADF